MIPTFIFDDARKLVQAYERWAFFSHSLPVIFRPFAAEERSLFSFTLFFMTPVRFLLWRRHPAPLLSRMPVAWAG